MTLADTIAIMLVMLFGLVLGGGITMVVLAKRWRRNEVVTSSRNNASASALFPTIYPITARLTPSSPSFWLAIKGRHPTAVQTAFALANPAPCSWSEGLAAKQQLFIAPPVNGWILVVGGALPCPDDDVDVCFRFLLALSRKLGHVQFFQADRVLNRHAWGRAETGRIVRAYAWAGKTLWNQGVKTPAEMALGMKCFAYDQTASSTAWGMSNFVAANVDKVPLLAARWSLNPAAIDLRWWEKHPGITGQLSRRY